MVFMSWKSASPKTAVGRGRTQGIKNAPVCKGCIQVRKVVCICVAFIPHKYVSLLYQYLLDSSIGVLDDVDTLLRTGNQLSGGVVTGCFNNVCTVG